VKCVRTHSLSVQSAIRSCSAADLATTRCNGKMLTLLIFKQNRIINKVEALWYLHFYKPALCLIRVIQRTLALPKDYKIS
jgi:hypothetical protein